MLLGRGRGGEDQNEGDVMGGGTSSVENVGVVGDFGHSNVVDEDLNMQPDQNKGDVMGVGQVVLKM